MVEPQITEDEQEQEQELRQELLDLVQHYSLPVAMRALVSVLLKGMMLSWKDTATFNGYADSLSEALKTQRRKWLAAEPKTLQ
jgi:hypothetical protein